MISNLFLRCLTTHVVVLEPSSDVDYLHLIVLYTGDGIYNQYCFLPLVKDQIADWGVGTLHNWMAKSRLGPKCLECFTKWLQLQ